jgi:hypothetical protein
MPPIPAATATNASKTFFILNPLKSKNGKGAAIVARPHYDWLKARWKKRGVRLAFSLRVQPGCPMLR